MEFFFIKNYILRILVSEVYIAVFYEAMHFNFILIIWIKTSGYIFFMNRIINSFKIFCLFRMICLSRIIYVLVINIILLKSETQNISLSINIDTIKYWMNNINIIEQWLLKNRASIRWWPNLQSCYTFLKFSKTNNLC